MNDHDGGSQEACERDRAETRPTRRAAATWLALGGIALASTAAVAAARAAAGEAPPAAAAAPASSGVDGGAPAGRSNVRIVFKTVPPTRATVSWGKRKLGAIAPGAPLIIERPRDSGPLDVVVRAEGCVVVHTRAYTFNDSTVAVKVTLVAQKNTIYGYREELPVDGGAPSADGGAPAPAPPAAPPPQ